MRCARCHRDNPPLARYCSECGLLLEGERRRVTVLVADVASSMEELIAGRDPEQAHANLKPVLERMMEAVQRCEGTVSQLLGDGITALFGAPVAHEDHPLRACYAALRMQETVQARIRVGLDSGEALVRAVAGAARTGYDAFGQPADVAAHIEKMAQPGSILATLEVMRGVEGYVQARSLGAHHVQGVAAPVELYEITGAAPVRTRPQRMAQRGLSRFVGRQEELAALERALQAARASQGQAVQLVGEPGVGKSRLLWEFVAAHRAEGWTVLGSSAISHSRATPYFPIVELLSRRFGIERSDPRDAVAERLRSELASLGLESAAAALCALFDAAPGDSQWEALDPPQRHRRIIEAVKSALIRPSAEQPTILVLEDLHYIDAESQDVLTSIMNALPGTRTLLLVEHRPEYSPDWASLSYCTQLRVEPLSQAHARELFRALAGEDRSLAPLERRLLERTEGNAFFLEESVRALAQGGALEGAPGAYRLARPLEAIEVPAMVQDVLAARLDLLPAADKSLLQLAAVIGREVSLDVLARVCGVADAELSAALARLQAAGFLAQASLFPELSYSFKHAFTHEIAYSTLSRQRRRQLHGEILDAMESLYAGRLAERVELLAHHALEGERWERAVPYLRKAAGRAYERSAYRDSVRLFDQAIRALAHTPAGREASELGVDLRLELRSPLLALGSVERMRASLREAEALAGLLGDELLNARVAANLMGYFWLIGEHRSAVELGSRTLTSAVARAQLDISIPTRFYLGAACHSMGNYRQAAELLETNIAALDDARASERFGMAGLPSVFSRAWLAWSKAELGEFPPALGAAREAVEIASGSGQVFSILAANFALAAVHMRRGSLPDAIRVLEAGLTISRTERMRVWVPPLAAQLGLALARSARVPEALALLKQALPEPSDALVFTPFASAVLAEVYLLAGRLEEAAQQAGRALARARQKEERGYEGWALCLLGKIAASADPPDAAGAEKHFSAALERARELGMQPLAARCQR